MIDTDPKVSTALISFIIAFSCAKVCEPNDSTIVIIDANASGTAATASAIANIAAPPKSFELIYVSPKTTIHRPIMPIDRFLENSSIDFCNGDLLVVALLSSSEILPISVATPILVTTARPLP